MKNCVETCWLAGAPCPLNWETAPLFCLKCKRDMPYEIDTSKYEKEMKAFAKGWIFSIFHFALYIMNQDLTLEQSEVMLEALTKRLFCSIDRGLGIEDFDETLENIMEFMRQNDTMTLLRAFGGSKWQI